MNTTTESFWRGDFGRQYTERNTFTGVDDFNALYLRRFGRSRDDLNLDFLADVPRDARVLEVGANIGNQLRALHRLGFRDLHGVELQRYCVEKSKTIEPLVDIVEGSADELPFEDASFDLVYTSNVLIHIPPQILDKVMDEMCRVSRRWIWGFEYWAPSLTEIGYRGHGGVLWKANYAELFLARDPSLSISRSERFEYLDEPGNEDEMYLLSKSG